MNKPTIQNLGFRRIFKNTIEVLFIIVFGFGLFIYSSTASLLSQKDLVDSQSNYNSFDLIFIVLYELIALSIIIYVLKIRKWTIQDFNLQFKWNMISIAFILVLARLILGYLVKQIIDFWHLFPSNTLFKKDLTIELNFIPIVLILIVNSFYEEFLLIGYLFKKLENYHPILIILISAVIRISFHTYQGFNQSPMVLILAVLFGIYYLKYKKLWPLILAHAIGNVFHFLNNQNEWINL